jgi:hypothetical protein
MCQTSNHREEDDRESRERSRADRARGGVRTGGNRHREGRPRWIEAGTREWLEQLEGAPAGRVVSDMRL